MFLPCAFLILACLALQRPAWAVELSVEEQTWLAAHGPVRMCVDPDWTPFERINEQGEHEGIAADLVRLAVERTGVRLELVRTKDWDESLMASREGRCDILSFLNQTPRREEWLIFTSPIFRDSNVFITREEHPFIDDPAALSDRTIVLPSGTALEEWIRRDYPNLGVVTVPSEAEAIDMVSDRRADMTMRSLIVAAYTIRKEGLFNLKIAGRLPGFENALRIGVNRTLPQLRDILDKGVSAITPQERGRIVNQHVAINVQQGMDYSLVAKIVAGFLVLGAIGLFWHQRLRKLNAELVRLAQTDSLTGLYNRTHIDTLLRQEFDRARRYGRKLSVIILDVDHFKRVNDEFGHLAGDRLLVALAGVLRCALRSTDSLGRWGGEEFLVLCPEAGQDEALRAADRLRLAVRGHDFGGGRVQTVSAGVAVLKPDDTTDSLLQRADSALYEAKRGGRDRACQGERDETP